MCLVVMNENQNQKNEKKTSMVFSEKSDRDKYVEEYPLNKHEQHNLKSSKERTKKNSMQL